MNHGPPFHAAKQVLIEFHGQFIAEVDANTVVGKLFSQGIISYNVVQMTLGTVGPMQQTEILHDHLMKMCTKESLMAVCDIFVAEQSNPKMRHLGEAMKRRLHTGKCAVC